MKIFRESRLYLYLMLMALGIIIGRFGSRSFVRGNIAGVAIVVIFLFFISAGYFYLILLPGRKKNTVVPSRSGEELPELQRMYDPIHDLSVRTAREVNRPGTVQDQNEKLKELSKLAAENKRLAMLGQLSAGVAHEINNPLTGIIVYSHLLLEDTDQSDPRYSNITKIIRESNRCKNIVKSLLDFARQANPQLDPCDVNIIVTEALNNMKRMPLFEHITVTEHLGEDLPCVLVDASQIQEVFENIIRNAAEAMNGSGELTITSRHIHDAPDNTPMNEIVFEDTGPGIPAEHMDRIFDPFFTTKTKGHGTGLGLAVCYGIIERHGGTVMVQNRNGGGAVFTVRLVVKEETG
ncbi:hypothetical protein LLG96_13180 [bacterium]|nr:hypothetical protein [bacterium]